MYKVKNALCSKFQGFVIFLNLNPQNTTETIALHFPRFTSTATHGKYLEPKLWSQLSTEERSCPSLETFKASIRKRDLSRFLKYESVFVVTVAALKFLTSAVVLVTVVFAIFLLLFLYLRIYD